MKNLYEKDKLANNLVNLTGATLRVYDEAGDIRKLTCNRHTVNDVVPILKCNDPYTYFILSKDTVEQLRGDFPRLNKVAVVDRWGVGRDGNFIVYLVCAEDMRTNIKFYENVENATFAHL